MAAKSVTAIKEMFANNGATITFENKHCVDKTTIDFPAFEINNKTDLEQAIANEISKVFTHAKDGAEVTSIKTKAIDLRSFSNNEFQMFEGTAECAVTGGTLFKAYTFAIHINAVK